MPLSPFYPKYGAGGKYPKATKVLPTTDTGYLAYGSAGRLFLPAGTNYCTNPNGVLHDSSGWSGSEWTYGVVGTPYSLVDDPAIGTGHAQRFHYVNGTLSGWQRYTMTKGSAAAGDVFTISWYWRGITTNFRAEMSFDWYDSSDVKIGSTIYATSVELASTQWTRYSYTTAAAPSGTSYFRITFETGYTEAGNDGWFDLSNVLIEKSAILTPYFDGSSPERGCSWSGAANASTSVRAASVLTLPAIASGSLSNLVGTMALRFSSLWAANDGLPHQLLRVQRSGPAAALNLYKETDNKVYGQIQDGTVSTNISSAAQSFAAMASQRFIYRYRAGARLDLDISGTTVASVATASAPALVDPLHVSFGPTCASAYIGPLAICPARITDAETALLSTLLTSCDGPTLYRWFYDRGYYGTLILPLQNDSMGYIVGGGSTYRDNYTYSSVAASTDTGYETYA